MKEVRTERLVLRKPGRADKEILASEIGDWEVAKWLSRVPHPYTTDHAEDWLKEASKDELNLSIFKNSSLIGGVGLTHDDDDYYELGYWIGRSYWGNGYATEAAKGLLNHAIKELNLNKFKSRYMNGNAESAKVLMKLGFTTIGEGEIYCLARNESVPCVEVVLEKSVTNHQI